MSTSNGMAPDGETLSDGVAFGVVSIIFGVLGLTPAFGVFSAIIGLITGRMGQSRARISGNKLGQTTSLIGVILSAITLAIAAIVLLFVGGAVGVFFGTH